MSSAGFAKAFRRQSLMQKKRSRFEIVFLVSDENNFDWKNHITSKMREYDTFTNSSLFLNYYYIVRYFFPNILYLKKESVRKKKITLRTTYLENTVQGMKINCIIILKLV